MKDYSKLATDLASFSNRQTESLNTKAQEAKHDSRMMKVATMVALAYIPTSLVAVNYPHSLHS